MFTGHTFGKPSFGEKNFIQFLKEMYDETITYATESSLEIFQNGSTKMQNALIEEWINSFKENMGSQVGENPIREIHCTVKSPFTNIEATFVFNVMEGVTVTKALLLYAHNISLQHVDLDRFGTDQVYSVFRYNGNSFVEYKYDKYASERKGLIVQCNFGLCAASEPYLY